MKKTSGGASPRQTYDGDPQRGGGSILDARYRTARPWEQEHAGIDYTESELEWQERLPLFALIDRSIGAI
jgi:hypothetical protein